MYSHHRPPYLLQLGLACHIGINYGACVAIDIVDAEYSQYVGKQRYKSKQNNRQYQALLQGKLAFH